MATEIKISGLPPVTVPLTTDYFPVVQGGVTKRESVLQAFVNIGGVVGPASATDNALCRFDGTTGKLIQNSVAILTDAGDLSGLNTLVVANLSMGASDIQNLSASIDFALVAAAANRNLVLAANGTGAINIKNSSLSGSNIPLNFYNGDNTHFVGFKAGTLTTDTTWIWPIADGTNGQFIKTNGAGQLSFAAGGTVTSITAGSNLTGGTITGSGTIALSSTPSGLTSLGVADLSLTAGFITGTNGITIAGVTSSSPVVLSPNSSFVALIDFGGTVATTLRFYNAAQTHFVGLKTTTGLATDTTFTLPIADGSNGQFIKTDGSGQLSFAAGGSGTVTSITAGTNLTGGTITTSGTINLASTLVDLTQLNVGAALGTGTGIVISANLITNISVNDLVIYPQGGHNLNLSPTLSGAVQLIDSTNTIAVPLRFFNSAGNNYIGFQAGTLSGSTTFTLPTGDGLNGYGLTTNGSGGLSFTYIGAKTLFNYFLASTQTNVTGDGTVVTLGALTQVTDRNGAMNGATQTFTSPVTGDYCFLPNIFLAGLGALNTNINITIVTTGASAGTYYPFQGMGIGTAALAGGISVSASYIIHMFAGDTAQCKVQVSGNPTKNVSINAGTAQIPTCLQGYVIP